MTVPGVPVRLGPGARLTLADGTDQVMNVDAAAGRSRDIRLPSGPGSVFEAQAAAGRLAVLRHDAGVVRLFLYRVQ